MTELARISSGKDRRALEICRYKRSDYIVVHLILSFFLTTIGFAGLFLLLTLGNMEAIMDSIEVLNLRQIGVVLALVYAGFLVVYLVIEGHLAAKHYDEAKRVERKYRRRLRELSCS
ncbi:MAG: hypothetical protein ACSW8H_07780 [bacterium]